MQPIIGSVIEFLTKEMISIFAARFGFIHGNWCLDNSRADGRWCGLNNELILLRELGCYADSRQILRVLSDFNNPVGIVTKSAMVTRDIDILSRMAEKGLAKVALSVTTLDPELARKMEPRAATPMRASLRSAWRPS